MEGVLLGTLAREAGLITQEQLDEGLAAIRRAPKKLADHLVERGALNEAQAVELRSQVVGFLEALLEEFPRRWRSEQMLGRLAVNLELVAEEQVRECIQERVLLAAEGVDDSLGSILVRGGYLTPYQLQELLSHKHVTMRCPKCEKLYSVLGWEEGFKIRCHQCREILVRTSDSAEGSAAKELFFDKQQAEELMTLGRLALAGGLLTKADLGRAVELQARSPGRSIGEVLVELGAFQPAAWKKLQKEMKAAQKKRLGETRRLFKDRDIGQIAIERGWIHQQMLDSVIEEQARQRAQGQTRRVGELLVEASYLTSYQLMQLLALQSKTLLACKKCQKKYNVLDLPEGEKATCPTCKSELESPEGLESVAVAGTVQLEAAQLVAVEPAPPQGADAAYHKLLLALREKAIHDLANLKDASSVQASPLDQTASLLTFSLSDAERVLKKSLDLSSLRDWVVRCLKKQAPWQVQAPGPRWLCPYCGVAAVEAAPDQLLDKILHHLATRCEVFTHVGMAPIFPEKELHRRAAYLLVKDRLGSDPAWQVRNRQGQWVCPVCLKTTDVALDGKHVGREVFARIAAHVAQHAWAPDDPAFKRGPLDVMKAAVRDSMAARLARQLKGFVKEHPVWRTQSAEGWWICPYCRKPQGNFSWSTPLELEMNLVPRAADHLVRTCEGFRKKAAPATRPEELTGKAPAGPAAKPAPLGRGGQQPPPTSPPPSVDLHAATEEEERAEQGELEKQLAEMRADLERARAAQQAMLPDLPRVPGLEIAVHYQPSDRLGGDFYDFIPLEGGRLGIVMGDVSGHGTGAALVMGMCKKVLSLAARSTDSPARALVLANEEIRQDLSGQTFVALWYGVVDPKAGNLRFARAGIEPLLRYHPQREPPVETFLSGGMAAGICAGAAFERAIEEVEIELRDGDLFCLCTDGITEAKGARGALFGRKRLEALLEDHGGDSPEKVVQEVLLELKRFSDRAGFDDDTTLVLFRHAPGRRTA